MIRYNNGSRIDTAKWNNQRIKDTMRTELAGEIVKSSPGILMKVFPAEGTIIAPHIEQNFYFVQSCVRIYGDYWQGFKNSPTAYPIRNQSESPYKN